MGVKQGAGPGEEVALPNYVANTPGAIGYLSQVTVAEAKQC